MIPKPKGGFMKKLVPLLLLSLFAMACDDLEGTIQVQSPLTLKTKKETITLSPGTKNAKLDLDEGDREIEIKFKDSNGKDKEAKVKFPAGTVIPKYSGSFTIESGKSGQNFTLNGTVNTDVREGNSISTTESCTYQREVVHYREVPVYNNKGQIIGYRREAYVTYQTVYGSRNIRYHNKTTVVVGQALFVEPQNGSTIATFNGRRAWTETIYEYRGRCY